MKRSPIISVLAVAGVLVAVQLVVTACRAEYYLTQMIMSAYYSIVVMGLCLVMGYAGQVSLGHAAFFAIGGYTSAVLTTRHLAPAAASGWGRLLQGAGILVSRPDLYGAPIVTFTPWAAFAAALLLTVLIAFLVGYPSLRLKGHYLAMATLGFGLIVYRLVLGSEITGTADGITGVPPWNLGLGLTVSGSAARRVQNYYLAWTVTLAVLLLLLNLVHSRMGRALRSIHEGELAANAMGVPTAAIKLQAFVLSAALAAVAGSLLTHYNGSIGPSEAGPLKSVRYVALVAAGGMANVWGGMTVSALINYLSLRGYFGTLDHAVFGLLLVAIISLAPEGPLPALGAWLRRAARAARPPRRSADAAA